MKYDGLLPGDQVRYGEFADKVELVEWTDGDILLGLEFRTESGRAFDRYDFGGSDFEVIWRPRVPWHIDISFRAWLTNDIDEFGVTYVPAERVNYWKPDPINDDNFTEWVDPAAVERHIREFDNGMLLSVPTEYAEILLWRATLHLADGIPDWVEADDHEQWLALTDAQKVREHYSREMLFKAEATLPQNVVSG